MAIESKVSCFQGTDNRLGVSFSRARRRPERARPLSPDQDAKGRGEDGAGAPTGRQVQQINRFR